jgi:hypothetical protein
MVRATTFVVFFLLAVLVAAPRLTTADTSIAREGDPRRNCRSGYRSTSEMTEPRELTLVFCEDRRWRCAPLVPPIRYNWSVGVPILRKTRPELAFGGDSGFMALVEN